MSNPYYNHGNQYGTGRGGASLGGGRGGGHIPHPGGHNLAAYQVPEYANRYTSGPPNISRGGQQVPNRSDQTGRSGAANWARMAAQAAFNAASPSAAPTPPSVYLEQTPSRASTPGAVRLTEYPNQVVDTEFCRIMDAMIPQYQQIRMQGHAWDPADIYYLYETLHKARSALQRGRPTGFFDPDLRNQVLGRT